MDTELSPAPLLVIDGDNLAHRAYHSTPKSVGATNGQPTNAIVGFVTMVMRIWREEAPRGIFVAWDTIGVDTYRSELWPPYQTGRIFEREILSQLELFPELCACFGFGVGKGAGYEADDFMAGATRAEVARGGTCLVLTTDRDAYQLISDRVTVLAPKRGKRELDRIGPLEVVELTGVLPEQIPDFKALSGDSSDKIPGLKGIGPKAAASLLLKHGTLENVMAGWSRPEDIEIAFKFREVTRMRPDCDVHLPKTGPDWITGAEALRKLGADSLADKVAGLGT